MLYLSALRSNKNAMYLLVKYFPGLVQFVTIQTVFYLQVLCERPAAVTDYVDADLGQNLILSSDSVIGNKEAVRLDITTTHLPSHPTHPRVRPYKLLYYGGSKKKLSTSLCLKPTTPIDLEKNP